MANSYASRMFSPVSYQGLLCAAALHLLPAMRMHSGSVRQGKAAAAKREGGKEPPSRSREETNYIRGSIPRTGWPFSVRKDIKVSGSSATVSSPIMSQKLSMP